jgi:hypothetical protein
MKLRAYLYALAGLVWMLVPLAAMAAIVPCGGAEGIVGQSSVGVGQGQSLSCDLCSFGQLIQNLINFLLGLSVPLAAGLFAWAGILYFSSRGVPAQIERAHKIFRSVVIGFVIAVAAWTMVQAVVTTLFNKSIFLGASWSSLDCSYGRAARASTVNKSLTQVIGGLPQVVSGTSGGTAYYCYQPDATLVNGQCQDSTGKVLGAPVLTSANATTNLVCPNSGYSEINGQCFSNDNPSLPPIPATPAATVNCPPGYSPMFDSCINNDGDVVNPNTTVTAKPNTVAAGTAVCPSNFQVDDLFNQCVSSAGPCASNPDASGCVIPATVTDKPLTSADAGKVLCPDGYTADTDRCQSKDPACTSNPDGSLCTIPATIVQDALSNVAQNGARSNVTMSLAGVDGSTRPITLATDRSDTTLLAGYNNAQKYSSDITNACQQYGSSIPNCQESLSSVCAVESGCTPKPCNGSNACGLMQIQPGTASKLDTSACPGGIDYNNPSCAFSLGAQVLSANYQKFGTVGDMFASYNGGSSEVWGTSPSGKNPAMSPSVSCDGLRAYQCGNSVGGLGETRSYVADNCLLVIKAGKSC